jgi:acyl-CoA thioesterase I
MKNTSLLVLLPVLALSLSVSDSMAGPVKIACIGDSITEGAGVDTPTVNAYPVVLGRLLGTNYTTKNFGVSGRTLLRKGDYPYWKESAFRNATNFAPDIVTIKLGTNDSKPQNWKYKDQFAPDLRDMINVFASLPSHPKIYLCLPVPAYSITFDINPDIIKNEIIPIIKQVAKEQGLATIDLYTTFSSRPELFPDDIHPNAVGAALIARTIQGAIISSTK